MAANKLLFLVTYQFICQYTYGQQHFRNDYKYLLETDSYYKIHTVHKPFEEAKKACEREGAVLYFPENDYETNVTLKYWETTQPSFKWLWIGVSATLSKGVFETVDGRSINEVYSKWGPTQPDDFAGNEDCVIVRRDNTLNDYECSYLYPFICKRTAASLEWNKDCDTYDDSYIFNKLLGKCYKYHQTPFKWTDAYALCSDEQSYLAILNSNAEAEHLADIVAHAPKDDSAGDKAVAVLLGIHNKFGGGWQTVKRTKLEDTGYAIWDAQQPDGGEKEQCGGMASNGKLHDVNCDTLRPFICEHDIQSLHFSVVERVLK